ncbi:uncharacterized protein LOC127858288 [Dreissena polymorpha]|uniref:uncharacterized protein LOC127858288 n=1 Tax=Dreissena polymorpha TaxID=45954 RepID=UPI002263C2CD|nr:uncharacterized protein LOC127858288 [Dreissena polymorpha]
MKATLPKLPVTFMQPSTVYAEASSTEEPNITFIWRGTTQSDNITDITVKSVTLGGLNDRIKPPLNSKAFMTELALKIAGPFVLIYMGMMVFIFRQKLCSRLIKGGSSQTGFLQSNTAALPDDSIYSFANETECEPRTNCGSPRVDDGMCIPEMPTEDPTYNRTMGCAADWQNTDACSSTPRQPSSDAKHLATNESLFTNAEDAPYSLVCLDKGTKVTVCHGPTRTTPESASDPVYTVVNKNKKATTACKTQEMIPQPTRTTPESASDPVHSVVNKDKKANTVCKTQVMIPQHFSNSSPTLESDDIAYSVANECKATDGGTSLEHSTTKTDDCKPDDSDYADIVEFFSIK